MIRRIALHRINRRFRLRMRHLGIAMIAVATAALSASCFFNTTTTLCETTGRRCGPGQVCSADQSACINIGGCGDGITSSDEVCDDGNARDGDGCSADCRSNETCGNNTTDTVDPTNPKEMCDDGNTVDGDGCSSDCRLESKVCGNGILDVEIEEDCDSRGVDSPGCNKNCKFTKCGDGYTNMAAMEQCDSSGMITAMCDGPLCTIPVCGDNFHNSAAGEECDTGGDAKACNGNGNGDTNNDSKSNCHVPQCGDGYTNPKFTPPGAMALPEQCDTAGNSQTCNGDDNNNDTNQGLGDCAKPKCGDGYNNPSFLPPGSAATLEQCDTGGNSQTCNGNDNDNATSQGKGDCAVPRCGDGYKNPNFTPPGTAASPEQCDTAGNSQTCNGNDNENATKQGKGDCAVPRCGDGYKNPSFTPPGLAAAPEQCDTGGNSQTCNGNDNDDVIHLGRGDCAPARCGDGYVNPSFTPSGAARPEECDVGDVTNGIPPILCGGGKSCSNKCNCF